MQYFGVAWNSFIASLEKTRTPVNEACAWCGEAIDAQSNGVMIPHHDVLIPHIKIKDFVVRPYHSECFVRTVIGSTLHQFN